MPCGLSTEPFYGIGSHRLWDTMQKPELEWMPLTNMSTTKQHAWRCSRGERRLHFRFSLLLEYTHAFPFTFFSAFSQHISCSFAYLASV